MSWSFSTDPDLQLRLDWAAAFVRDEVEHLDHVLGDPYDKSDPMAAAVVPPLQQQVREAGLWAAHLSPDLGGQGYGQLPLALLNELLGASRWAPTIFGCQAPDSGNAEILATRGTDEQKARYLQPLLEGRISSCYAMTEPHAGADPALFTTRARRDGGEWVIDGEKWFASSARYASFLLVMAVTDPDVDAHRGMSMFILPSDTAGLSVVRNVGVGGEPAGSGSHGYLRFEGVRVPEDHLLGGEGEAFAIAQERLGGGRIHHAMRTIGAVRKAFDMMCERALSRQTRNGPLASLATVQADIADSWVEMEQFRLLVLRTAWLIDEHNDYRAVRKDISAVKAVMPKVFHDVVRRAMHLHGALGVSDEMPFFEMLMAAEVMGIADGPTEVHQQAVARDVLRSHRPVETLFPSEHLPTRREAARHALSGVLDLAAAGR